MNRLLLIIVLTFGFSASYGQNSEKISARTIKPLYITYNTADELLQPKQLTSALELKVKVKDNNWNVFAQLTGSDANFYDVFNNKVALRLQNHDSYSASTIQEVLLSQNPMLLFSQPAVSNTEHFNFYYDVVLYPFTTFVTPGQYNFYVTFTMTQP